MAFPGHWWHFPVIGRHFPINPPAFPDHWPAFPGHWFLPFWPFSRTSANCASGCKCRSQGHPVTDFVAVNQKMNDKSTNIHTERIWGSDQSSGWWSLTQGLRLQCQLGIFILQNYTIVLPNPWFFITFVQNPLLPVGGGISRSLVAFPGHWPAFPDQPPGISRSLAGISRSWVFGHFGRSKTSANCASGCKCGSQGHPVTDFVQSPRENQVQSSWLCFNLS